MYYGAILFVICFTVTLLTAAALIIDKLWSDRDHHRERSEHWEASYRAAATANGDLVAKIAQLDAEIDRLNRAESESSYHG